MLKNIKTKEDILQEYKISKKAEVNETRERSLNLSSSTVQTVDGRVWNADPSSVKVLNEALTLFTALGSVPEGYVWRDKDNVNHPADLTLLINISSAKAEQVNQIWKNSWALKEAIDSASTKEEVDLVIIPEVL